jgi:hypothetical protein
MKITPVLFVDEIEKSLPFWVDRMGFEKTVEVPEGDKSGFVILVRDDSELMLQSISSLLKDIPAFAPQGSTDRASLYIEVDDFEDILKRLEGYPITLEKRTSFYGMHEIGVIDPGGHNVIFSSHAA